ncbi:MAG: invasion associated locus B family protein [Rhizobiaceae bacterium]
MRGLIAIISILGLVLVSGTAIAQTATKIGQNHAWGTYSYQSNSGKVCYVLSVPTARQPSGLDHGDIFFFVSQKPGQNIAYEPQFIAAYNFRENSKVKLTIDDKSFSMFTKGNSAWLENAAEEPQLVALMKAGTRMKIDATSGRGNPTSYDFSLSGITAALDSISNCR